MITRSDIASHLENGIRTGFVLGKKAYSPLRRDFVRDVPSDGAFEDYADMLTVPMPSRNAGKQGPGGTKAETDTAKVGSLTSGQAVTVWGGSDIGLRVYNVDWEIVLGVTHNSINDDRAGDVETWGRDAGQQFERHMDFMSFDALNNGEATTKYGSGYDKQAFFSASHADPGAAYTTAQDNQFALALTGLDNFETVKVAASSYLDDRGQVKGLMPNLLIVPPALERIGYQITGNPRDFGTANAALNPYAGTTRLIVAPGGWLDSTAWFLIDTNWVQKPLNLQIRQAPMLDIWDDLTQGDGGIRYFKWRARYNIFYGDWRLATQGNT